MSPFGCGFATRGARTGASVEIAIASTSTTSIGGAMRNARCI